VHDHGPGNARRQPEPVAVNVAVGFSIANGLAVEQPEPDRQRRPDPPVHANRTDRDAAVNDEPVHHLGCVH
jgi:hypothetical protein